MAAIGAAKRNSVLVWGLMAFLAVGVGLHGLSYLMLGRSHLPPEVASNGFAWPYMIIAHAGFAGLALLVGPFQFLRGLRAKRPHIHRWTGRVYVACCIAGGVSGGLIGPFASTGPVAASGFTALAVAWLITTAMAYRYAVARDFARHERWMVRSFALTLAAVTLRLYLPLGVFALGFSFAEAYSAIAWLAWVPNLIAAEIWLAARRPQRARAA